MQSIKAFIKKHFPALFQLLFSIRHRLMKGFRKDPNFHKSFHSYPVQQKKPNEPVRRKVLHIIANFYTGGSARLVVDLAEHLGHLYRQEVITKDVPERAAYTGLPVTVVPGVQQSRERMEALLKAFQPDLVHIHNVAHLGDEWGKEDYAWYQPAFAACEQLGLPVMENINIPTEPIISNSVARYVYVSRYVLEQFSRPADPNEVIYPGSDFAHFSRSENSAYQQDCIGMVYRLDGDKVNEKAIDVFIEVVKQRPRTKVLIVGGGSLLAVYKEAVKKAGVSHHFQFTGYVAYEDLPRYFAQLSVFVAPVHNESFGQVTPFAMSMELPVAAYKVGALPEILANDELLAPAGDHQQLAAIIIGLLNNRERSRQVGRQNRQRAVDLFSVETMTEAYRKLYEEMMLKAAQ